MAADPLAEATLDLSQLDDGQLLAHLRDVAGAIDRVNTRQAALWAQRLAIYQEGRSRDPKVTQQQLAEAAGVSEVAIIQALKKATKKADAAAAAGG